MERNEDMIYTMLQRLQESVLVLAGVRPIFAQICHRFARLHVSAKIGRTPDALTHLSTTLKG